ncbi:hypothetical protein [Nocardia sp. SSK8]|uniref:hypothetical protein n=1 Tax=Nocardia sp. SSK8 TaxID=3120154 RepID=UPI00300A71C5
MREFARGSFVAVAAAGLVIGAAAVSAADTGTGSAGYFGNPECLLNSLLTYGTFSAGDAPLPGCLPI